MKIIFRLISFLIIWGLQYHLTIAQVKYNQSVVQNTYSVKGDFYLDRYEFKKAIIYYNRAFKKDTTNYYPILKKAEAYSKLNLPVQAEESYRMAFESQYSIDNEFYLKYALALLVNKKFSESKEWFNKYNLSIENDLRGSNYINSINNKDELYKDSTIQFVENVRELNTKESDINPISLGSILIFASSRPYSIDVVSNSFYDIFFARKNPEGNFEKTNPLNHSINTNLHEGPMAVNGDKTRLFFTRNTLEENTRKVKLGIYETSVPKDVNEKLSISVISIEDFEYSMGHPAVNSDGNIMYFTSNATGGKGGLDIYKSTKSDKGWSYPKNIGRKVNTRGDEMFPYLLNDSILFFASDGHGGLGGLDIYKINLKNPGAKVVNLGYPINSSYDDFSISSEIGEKSGYFSSNRLGGFGSDDIYKFDILKFKVKGNLLDADDNSLSEDAKIRVILEDGKEYYITKSENGEFDFSIIPKESYTLAIVKEDYRSERIFFDDNIDQEMKKQMLIEQKPMKKAEFNLEPGQKYNFLLGYDSIGSDNTNNLESFVNKQEEQNKNTKEIKIISVNFDFFDGEVYSIQLIKNESDDTDIHKEDKESLLLVSTDTLKINDDSVRFELPPEEGTYLTVQSDLNIFDDNKDKNVRYTVDNFPTNSDDVSTLSPEQQEALDELKHLMNLSINTTETRENSSMKSIVADGFSIIPGTPYNLKVEKKDSLGNFLDRTELSLTKDTKYDFQSGQIDSDYRQKLKELLEGRENLNVDTSTSIDISILSKQLEIKEGEEFVFTLLPTDGDLGEEKDELGSTIILEDKTYEITSREKYQIIVPYTSDKKVNIKTNIEHLQKNFKPEAYITDIDTIPFFSEILVDTTGYWEQYKEPVNEFSQNQIDIPSPVEDISTSDIIYRVQINASRKRIPKQSLKVKYKGNLEIKHFEEDGWQKYYIADAPSYFEAKQVLNTCGVKGAFIVAYKDGEKLPLKNAISKQYKERMENNGQAISDSIVNIVTINFEFNEFSLRSDEEKYLQELVIDKLKENPHTYVTVNGHTDIRGTDVYNFALSQERAEVVKSLIVKQGIEESRIQTFSFGETQVLKSCEQTIDCDDSVHQVNRRVEIVLFLPKE